MKKFFLFVMMAVVGMSAMAQWTVQGIPYNNPKAKMPIMKAMPMATANDSFSFDDIQNWTGEGENQAAVVIQFNTGKESETNALVFGYRWNGTATGTDMIVAIAKEDPRFYVLANNGSYGYSIGGIGWDADEDGDIYLKNGDQTFTLTDGKYECSSEYDYDNFTAGDADDLWAGGWFAGYWSYWVASDTPANFGYSGVGASGRELTDGCWDGWNFSANYGSYAWLPFAAAPSLIPAGATTQFKVDGIYYTLDSYQKKTVMVSVPFEMENQEKTTYAGDIKIPSTFTQDDVVYTVVGIADDAFAGVQIGEVELPETVTAIGKRAFQNSTLTSINVTDNITKIGVAAFSGCSKLTEYKLPTSLKSIPDELYKGTAITAVTFSETIESIGVSAFENCTKIETLDIPATLKAIGTGAFAGCDGLKNVKVKTIFPLAITEDIFSVAAYENATLIVPVGYTAVYATSTGWKNFKKVEEVAISVAQGDNFYVGNVAYTITECSEAGNKVMVTYFPVESVSDNNIKAANLIGYVGDVVVPAKVSYQNIEFTVDGITAQAFMGAEEMMSIKFNCVVKSINQYAFSGCSSLQAISIPESVISIGTYVFNGCTALKSITVPQGVTTINNYTFQNCTALESVTLGNKVKTLGNYAFYGCSSLKVIELPETISTLGSNLTVGATNLSVYVCNATPFAWNNSFKVSDEAYAPIYVVYGAKADYNAANNWNLSAVNEVVPTIAVDMENKVNVLNYEVASFAVPMTYTYEESVPTRFIEANNTIVEAEADVVVKFKKVIEKGVSLQDLEGYTSVEAQLNEDGTYSADLLRYLEPNTKYEYHWEFVLGNNEPVVGAVDYFTTSDMITEVENIGVSIDNAEYYNMQGVKVAYPTNGIFIMKQGNKTIKVIR